MATQATKPNTPTVIPQTVKDFNKSMVSGGGTSAKPTSILYQGTYINPAYASPEAKAKGTVVEAPYAGGIPGSAVPIPRVTPTDTTKKTDGSTETPLTFEETQKKTFQDLMSQSSGYLNAIGEKYNLERKTQEQIGKENLANVRGIGAAAGMGGSGELASMRNATTQYTADQIAKVEANRVTDIGSAIQTIQNNATLLAEKEYQADITARATAKADAQDVVKTLSASHTDWNKFKTDNPNEFKNLVQHLGGDENYADALYVASLPAQNILNTMLDGSKATVITQDPVTGKVSANSYDMGVEVPKSWTMEKIGTNAVVYHSSAWNPTDPSTYQIFAVDPLTGLPTTQIGGNQNPTSPVAPDTITSAVSNVASVAGVEDPSTPLAQVVEEKGIDSIINGIIANEGSSPAGVENNPGNILFAGQAGAKSSGVLAKDSGKPFASFDTMENGKRAIGNIINNAISGASVYGENPSFASFINKYTGQKVGDQAVPTTGKEYGQIGLLANTTYNPTNEIDKKAKSYIDYYIKNGAFPTSYALGMGRTAAASNMFSNVGQRANELYYEATGQSLPDVQILKETKKLVTENNKVLNKNVILADTIKKNFELSIEGEITNDVNKNATLVNKVLNPIYLALGDPAVNQALVSNGTISQEFANLISIRNASGTTVADKAMSEELIKFGTSVEAQKAVVERLKAEAMNIHSALQDQNAELYKIIDPLQTDPQNPNRNIKKDIVKTVKSNGQEYNVGQVYNDGTANWVVDEQGNWSKQ